MKRHYFKRSTHKFEKGVINEDAAISKHNCLAVSDGAGGGGVFAERWSKYLLKMLPSSPITTFHELDSWVDSIWEVFYNECEEDAKARGGLFLEKFYDEGSFATLAATWRVSETEWQWMTYGDSVVFHYNKTSGLLEHSPISLADFDKAPYLISDKEPLQEEGFNSGSFKTDSNSFIFVASDTLAHYILMMYYLSKKDTYQEEINKAIANKSKNSNFILTAMNTTYDFPKILNSLLDYHTNFRWTLRRLERQGLLGHDDYSIAVWRLK